ncbi:LysM peptidoglycan-binding domain-containing protein [Streptomyces sp. 378]|uniref:LysM peptidoglycan-binding domain-containing protein n=1 Tax=Streptomyces sp. 378 TaxID=3049412 RepID=UPI0024C331B3|nr:LysM peptidoglycan-binding domain-containing protein [Streptomyces sp. 378]MDK1344475.1 LysM peptidoglycan-binding domain-containing protein [Streptomyces sp. 378]
MVTRSGPAPLRSGTAGHVAALAEVERFLTLLWECSVVGGGGYWLHLAGDVPESVFDQDGNARLTLIVQPASLPASEPDRSLHPFTNAVVVGDGVDPASVALSVRADPPELRSAATADPGRIGFTARLAKPDDEDTTPQEQLRRLYGLLGYQLLDETGLPLSGEGRPLSPRPADGSDALGLPVTADEDAEAEWEFSRAVDISRFAASRVPQVPGMPPADGDPYAGDAADATATISVWFGDVFGNRSGDPCEVPVPVRYTDPVLGVGALPSTTTRYTVEKAGDLAELNVAVDLQAVAFQPGPLGTGAEAAATAAGGRERFAAACRQLMQPDVTARLLTSLQQSPGAEPTPLPAGSGPLRRYVAGTYILLGCLSAVGSAVATGASTLDEVCRRYGVGFDALAAVNAGTSLDLLVGGSVAVPVSAVFRHGDTVTALCAALTSPPDPGGVLLDEDNIVLPLSPGTELAVPPHEETVPGGSPSAAALAAPFGCSLARLVTANLTRPGLLTPGFVFEVNGLQVAVATDPPESEATLAGVTGVFNSADVPLGAVEIVALNADQPGMFRTGAAVVVDGYLAVSGDTLAANGAERTPDELAPLNTGTPDLFPPGTPVFLTTVPTPVPSGETLARFAEVHGTTPGDLLRHNGAAPLPAGTAPVVPGRWAWPDSPTRLRVPYTVRTGDSLAALSERFPGADLVEVNAGTPGTVAPGVTVTVDGLSVTTTAAASFDEVRSLFTPPVTPTALATALGERTDVLAPGALLFCPPGVVPAAPSGETGVTPQAAADAFGITAVALLAANAGTPDLLLPDRPLRAGTTASDGGEPGELVEVTTASDTLTAVVERLRRRGISTDVETVADANATEPVLRPGARVVVPPATACLSARLGEGGWVFPGPVFPVTVTLEVSRDPARVDPALAESATRHRTAVPATRTTDPAQGGARGLAAFAERLHHAVPPLRLATGHASGTDLWAVVFGENGIKSVSIGTSGQPRTFALRPLSTTLVSLQRVSTPVLDGGKIIRWEERDHQGADAEVWARSFLADVERVLSPACVRGAYGVAPAELNHLVDVKERLAEAVANGLAPVLAADGEDADDARTAAAETLRQELLASLPRGYETPAVLQYDTSVDSVWPDTYARLTASPVLGAVDAPLGPGAAALSGGKISLADSEHGRLSLLLSLPDPAEHAALDLTPHLSLPEIEFGIEPGTDGYERSDWLTFLTPLSSGDPAEVTVELGSPRVPIPLRTYPPTPVLLDHQALVPVFAGTLRDALHWQYRCTVRHQSAEQDTVELTMVFNQSTAATALAVPSDGLFIVLARYTAVAAPLTGLLSGLRDREPPPGGVSTAEEDQLADAPHTFTRLASMVAAAWAEHWNDGAGTAAVYPAVAEAPLAETYRYTLRVSRMTTAPRSRPWSGCRLAPPPGTITHQPEESRSACRARHAAGAAPLPAP